MVLRHNGSAVRPTFTSAPAFVMCPAALNVGASQAFAQPHAMYAYAFEQAQRVVAQEAFRRLHTPSVN